MRARFIILAATVLGLLAGTASPAHAAHHLWRFSQLFSTADGSVQYIQLAVNEDGENQVANFTINSGTNTFTFPGPLSDPQTTVHKWILLGTANLATLPGGVTPDFVIPANFFPVGGGTLNYAGVDVWNYGPVPTDRRNALFKSGATVTTGVNAPANFNLQTGSLLLSTTVPAASGRWIAVLVGALLLSASGLLRLRRSRAGRVG
jgi:hypothetical protein